MCAVAFPDDSNEKINHSSRNAFTFSVRVQRKWSNFQKYLITFLYFLISTLEIVIEDGNIMVLWWFFLFLNNSPLWFLTTRVVELLRLQILLRWYVTSILLAVWLSCGLLLFTTVLRSLYRYKNIMSSLRKSRRHFGALI